MLTDMIELLICKQLWFEKDLLVLLDSSISVNNGKNKNQRSLSRCLKAQR